MIKAGIAGAASKRAGELIRVLVNHPEVELTALYAPECAGRSAVSVHHGLIGETNLSFTDRLDPQKLDVVFVDNDADIPSLLERIEMPGEKSPCVIDLTGHAEEREGYVCGISELFRKSMVRGARRAYIPSPGAVISLVALYPLAVNLLLNSKLEISISAPDDTDMSGSAGEVSSVLRSVQQSFPGDVEITRAEAESSRGIRIRTRIASAMQVADIMALYESIYDDHRFTFMLTHPLHISEVVGTEKCLISITKPSPGEIEIDAVADGRLRGGAGDAVHAMNLLFALHEKTGLALKAATF